MGHLLLAKRRGGDALRCRVEERDDIVSQHADENHDYQDGDQDPVADRAV